jgi:competence protein ComGC
MTAQQKKTAGIAITSLVLGILGLLTIWFCGIGALFAIPAVICGHIGYSRVRKSAGALGGEGVAMTGLITGYVGIGLLLTVVPLLAAIAIPSFVNARDKSMQSACYNNLRLIEGATQQYALDNSNALPTSLAQLVGPSSYLKTAPVCVKGGTYKLPAKLDDAPACSVHGKLR